MMKVYTQLINTKMIQRKCGYRLTDRLNYTQMNIVKQPNQLLLSTLALNC